MAAVALDKKALWREIEKDARQKRRTVLAELRDRLKAAREKRKTTIAGAKALCKTSKLEARARARALEADAKATRQAARGTCAGGKAAATIARTEVVSARSARDAELAAQRETRKVDALAKGAGVKKARSSSRERAGESDDEVRANIPPELVRLFDRVKGQIKSSPRKSRTEAFLEYAEQNEGEVFAAIDDQTDALIAELERRQREEADAEEFTREAVSNPGELVELGKLTHVIYKPDGSRRRTLSWGVRSAPILAYTGNGRASLVVVYGLGPAGKSSSAAAKEYARTHWGKTGAGRSIDGLRALAPFDELGEVVSLTYTTEKGGDAALVDYEHAFGDGAKGEWRAPTLHKHRCGAPRCAGEGMVCLRGGSYRVTSHGIVG